MRELSHKNLAIGTAVILVSLTAILAFVVSSCEALQTINPVAALTAIAVAIVGIAWFKKNPLTSLFLRGAAIASPTVLIDLAVVSFS